MALTSGQTVSDAVNFFIAYIFPYLATLLVALIAVAFAFAVSGRRARGRTKKAFLEEMKINERRTAEIVAYADGQLTGGDMVTSMPRYEVRAFSEFSLRGMLSTVRPKVAEELNALYLSKRSVNKAADRQEDLAFGPAAAHPNAHNLRVQNLTYARDTAHNVIEPYQDRLRTTKI